MTCPICNGTGVVTEVLSTVGEPPDYEPVDCQCVKGAEVTVDDLRVGYDWRAEPPVRRHRDAVKRTLDLRVRFEVYAHDGQEWDIAEQVADEVKKVLASKAGELAAYGCEVDIASVE